MHETEMISALFVYIANNGEQTSVARSASGRDRYWLCGIAAFLEDDGNTRGVSTERLCVRDTLGGISYSKGTIKDLGDLYAAVFGKEEYRRWTTKRNR